jgi:hypothetical protein
VRSRSFCAPAMCGAPPNGAGSWKLPLDTCGAMPHRIGATSKSADSCTTWAPGLAPSYWGPRITTLILERAPVTVRVIFPPSAADLLTLPLDLAHPGSVSDKPLALQDVSLVFEIEGEVASVRARGVGERLRMLALFSLPPTASPLNLRRERQMLRQLVAELRGASGKAVELRVLQYGTTRQSLEAALQEGLGHPPLLGPRAAGLSRA